MSAPKVIYNLLSNSTQLTDVVGNRIYFGAIPERATLPALTYARISEYETVSVSMTSIKLRSRVQITIASKSYAQVEAILKLVKGACDKKQGNFNGVQTDSVLADGVGADFRDDDLNIYYSTIDFRITHDEAEDVITIPTYLLADIGVYLVSDSNRILAQ